MNPLSFPVGFSSTGDCLDLSWLCSDTHHLEPARYGHYLHDDLFHRQGISPGLREGSGLPGRGDSRILLALFPARMTELLKAYVPVSGILPIVSFVDDFRLRARSLANLIGYGLNFMFQKAFLKLGGSNPGGRFLPWSKAWSSPIWDRHPHLFLPAQTPLHRPVPKPAPWTYSYQTMTRPDCSGSLREVETSASWASKRVLSRPNRKNPKMPRKMMEPSDPAESSRLCGRRRDAGAPGGLPWDAKQTPGEASKTYVLEKPTKVADPVERSSPEECATDLGTFCFRFFL